MQPPDDYQNVLLSLSLSFQLHPACAYFTNKIFRSFFPPVEHLKIGNASDGSLFNDAPSTSTNEKKIAVAKFSAPPLHSMVLSMKPTIGSRKPKPNIGHGLQL